MLFSQSSMALVPITAGTAQALDKFACAEVKPVGVDGTAPVVTGPRLLELFPLVSGATRPADDHYQVATPFYSVAMGSDPLGNKLCGSKLCCLRARHRLRVGPVESIVGYQVVYQKII